MGYHKNTDATRTRLLERLAEGWSFGNACKAAGITRATLWNWRNDDPEFDAQVRDAIEAGLDQAEDAIRKHWRRDWRAAQASLVAKRRTVWGANRIELTGADGGPIEVEALTDIDRAARVAALLAAAAARQIAQAPAPMLPAPDLVDDLLR